MPVPWRSVSGTGLPARLLGELAVHSPLTEPAVGHDPATVARRWAASGAAGLSGWPGRAPAAPPAALAEGLEALGVALSAETGAGSGDPVRAAAYLADRAAWTGWRRRGRTSVGAATRLLRSADRWVALTLARPDDVAAVPALLAGFPHGAVDDEPSAWAAVERVLAERPGRHWVAQATLLGVPCALLGEAQDAVPGEAQDAVPGEVQVTEAGSTPDAGPGSTPGPGPAVVAVPAGRARPPGRAPLVVDLSAMWAGPLCAHLLGRAGATVVKVESPGRPDGARRGDARFYDLLHAGHEAVTAELGSPELAQALEVADVVIEASRPRALAQAGIRAGATGTTVWVSITGHGRDRPDRVGFGDEAAVAGGLVATDHHGEPVFCADAVADPLTGMVAALAAWAALRSGQRWLLDISLSRVAAAFAGPPLAAWAALVDDQGEPEPPRRRSAPSPAPGIGAHGPLSAWMQGRPAGRLPGSA